MENNHIKEVQVKENIKIVLRKWNDITPYVVHLLNIETGGYTGGEYCGSLKEAEEVFKKRVNRHL